MYQRLVTQFSNTLSQVLLLAPAGEFANQIQIEFEQRGFSVHFINLIDFLQNDQLQLDLQKQSFYKIVTLFGWTEKPLDYQLLTHFLQFRHEPTLIISRLDTFPNFSAKEQLRLQQVHCQQLAAIEYFADNLSKKTLLIGQDIISSDCCHLLFRFICRQQNQNRLIDPEIDFSPLPCDQFLIQNLATIFSPYDGERFLFCAQPIKSEKILFRLSELSGATTQIISHPYESKKTKLSFSPLSLFGKTDLKFLTNNFFAHLLQQLEFEKISPPIIVQPAKKLAIKNAQNINYKSNYSNKNVNNVLRGANHNEEFFQHFPQEIASQEEKILRHYHSQAPYQHLSLQVPSCNLLHGKLVCALPEKKALVVPPIVEISCYHQDDLFFSPLEPPFSTSRHLKTTAKHPIKSSSVTTSTLAVKQPVKILSQKLEKEKKSFSRSQSSEKIISKKILHVKKPIPLCFSKFSLSPIFFVGFFLFLIAFCIFILPLNNLDTNQKKLQTFFSSCQEKKSCFNQETFSFLQNNFQEKKQTQEINQFVSSLNAYFTQKQVFENQVNRLYRTILQKEPGDVIQEINLVDQALTNAVSSLNDVDLAFNQAQKKLQTFVSVEDLTQFKDQLTAYKTQLLLWKKYKDLFIVLAQQDKINLALLVLDNVHLLNQGGQFIGAQNLNFSQGKIVESHFVYAHSFANAKAIKIDNPIIFKDLSATSAAGLYNSPYQENFSDFYQTISKTISSATAEPDLVISLNFNSFSQLAAPITNRKASEIFSQIENQLNSLSLPERENFAFNLNQNLGQIIANLNDRDQVVAFFFALLKQFNQQEMLFASHQPALKDLIESANLNHQLNTRSCPSSLGGNVCYIDSFVQLRSLLSGENLIPLQIDHVVVLNPQETVHARTLTYQNQNKIDSRETINFLLPEQTIDVNFSLNGKDQLPNTDGSYSILVPAGQQLSAVLTYVVPRSLEQNNFVYSFAEQKQSGAYNQTVSVSFKNNLPYNPKVVAPSATIDGKKITFNSFSEAGFLGAIAF